MATTILTHNEDAGNGLACGIGRTREIADRRAIDMYVERVMKIDARTQPVEAAIAVNETQDDIDAGNLWLVRFG